MQPKISVVMPVWNGEKFLQAAIESVLKQSFADFEFVIVDDGSTDGTRDILASYSDRRITVHRLDHGGIVTALNFGMSVARSEWIARQDADDISHPDRFALQWRALEQRPETVLSYTDVSLVGQDAGLTGQARFPRTRAMLALRLCRQNPIVHSTVMFQKEAFVRAGGYRPEERHAEDFALWGRLLPHGDFVGLPDRLLSFRLHAQSVSKANLETQSALAAEIALAHCRAFMNLSEGDARHALAVLSTPRHPDWSWFLCKCAPRLRWKSAELYSWLALQTLKRLRPGV